MAEWFHEDNAKKMTNYGHTVGTTKRPVSEITSLNTSLTHRIVKEDQQYWYGH